MANNPELRPDYQPAPVQSGGVMKVLIPILAICVLVPTLSYYGVTWALKAVAEEAVQSAPQTVDSGAIYRHSYQGLAANLSGTMATRGIVVSFQVNSRNPNLTSIVNNNDARIRDAVLTLLSQKTMADANQMATLRNSLRREIRERINAALEQNLIDSVEITELYIR